MPYTRTTEYRHLTGQAHHCSTLAIDYPCAEGDPYYPMPRPENQALYQRYKALADGAAGVTFVGPARPLPVPNMDQVVGQALSVFERVRTAGPRLSQRSTTWRVRRVSLPAALRTVMRNVSRSGESARAASVALLR